MTMFSLYWIGDKYHHFYVMKYGGRDCFCRITKVDTYIIKRFLTIDINYMGYSH